MGVPGIAGLLSVPSTRAGGLEAVLERLREARRIVLTTHLNADGDGAGSQVALAAWFEEQGGTATIVNPTPFPSTLSFLVYRDGLVAELGSAEADAALREAELLVVLDTSEAHRIGAVVGRVDPERTIVVDHHPPGPDAVGTMRVQDPTAAATGELMYDLLSLAGSCWPHAAVQGIYVALVSDTGSFRFSNTTPRAHAVAAELLARGVDPEMVFQRLFASFPARRMELLREALGTLQVDAELGLAWMVIPHHVAARLQCTPEDFEGLIDHARSVEGTEVAVLFREMPDGVTKISIRSNGLTDVNRIARDFGGGGHVKAAGAVARLPAEQAVPAVLERVRKAVREAGKRQ